MMSHEKGSDPLPTLPTTLIVSPPASAQFASEGAVLPVQDLGPIMPEGFITETGLLQQQSPVFMTATTLLG